MACFYARSHRVSVHIPNNYIRRQNVSLNVTNCVWFQNCSLFVVTTMEIICKYEVLKLHTILSQSGMVIKFDNPDQNKPINNRCSDSSSRDMLLWQQFWVQHGVRRPNQTELLSNRTCNYSLNFSNRKLKICTVIKFWKQTDFPLVYFVRDSLVVFYVRDSAPIVTKTPHDYIRVHTGTHRWHTNTYEYMRVTYEYIRATYR